MGRRTSLGRATSPRDDPWNRKEPHYAAHHSFYDRIRKDLFQAKRGRDPPFRPRSATSRRFLSVRPSTGVTSSAADGCVTGKQRYGLRGSRALETSESHDATMSLI